MTYEPFSIIAVPFPFTDKPQNKRRPALVISSHQHQIDTKHITLLIVTSAKNSAWSSDYQIKSLDQTGLTAASIVRQKIFSIDERLVIKKLGHLDKNDQEEVYKRIKKHLHI
ncbi:MAG: type II toxin-antitoxin system PemK/MazF family toxin [Gammaproteobacteria bacterium]